MNRRLDTLEVSCLLVVSRLSSMVSKRLSLVDDWRQMVRNLLDMLGGIYVQILKSYVPSIFEQILGGLRPFI